MKKLFFLTALISISFSNLFSQIIWKGSNTTENAYRTGNVGIGTDSPSTKLSVLDNNAVLNFGENSGQTQLKVGNKASGYSALVLDAANGDFSGSDYAMIYQNNDLDLKIETMSNAGDIVFMPKYGAGLSDAKEAMRLTKTGKVGIGTSTPRGQLDVVKGNVWLTGSETAATNDLYAPGHIYLIPRANGVSYIQSRRPDNSGSTEMQLRTWNNGSASEAIRIKGNGNVGIGETNPAKKLYIQVSSHGDGLTINNSVDQGGTYISLADHDGKQANIVSFTDDFADANFKNSLQFFARSGKNIHFATSSTTSSGTNKMVILNNGNVGIGTSNPSELLTVKGKILAGEVQIENVSNIPDYVFEEDYNLRSIAEVDSYIKENKHLPDVPSASELEENGYNIGDMNNILLKKVEELTLYVIDLKKNNEDQQKLIEQLQTEVKLLKNEE
jgi:hypothetical protein